jgi:hypothetical protein
LADVVNATDCRSIDRLPPKILRIEVLKANRYAGQENQNREKLKADGIVVAKSNENLH